MANINGTFVLHAYCLRLLCPLAYACSARLLHIRPPGFHGVR